MSEVVAVIPARGGSKRIPGKNKRLFNGVPMIVWPIQSLLESNTFSRVIVSTDDLQIASLAEDAGAEVPFLRPEDLSGDLVGAADVIRHSVKLLGLGEEVSVMNVYPTAPLPPAIFADAASLHGKNREHFVVGVGRYRTPIERSLRADLGLMAHEDYSASLIRTQDLPEAYFDAGKFHIATVSLWETRPTMMSQPFVPFFLPEWSTVDIDEEQDWEIAEVLHRAFALDVEA